MHRELPCKPGLLRLLWQTNRLSCSKTKWRPRLRPSLSSRLVSWPIVTQPVVPAPLSRTDALLCGRRSSSSSEEPVPESQMRRSLRRRPILSLSLSSRFKLRCREPPVSCPILEARRLSSIWINPSKGARLSRVHLLGNLEAKTPRRTACPTTCQSRPGRETAEHLARWTSKSQAQAAK